MKGQQSTVEEGAILGRKDEDKRREAREREGGRGRGEKEERTGDIWDIYCTSEEKSVREHR